MISTSQLFTMTYRVMNLRAVYFLAILVLNLVQLAIARELGEICYMDKGSSGYCVGIKDCPEAIELLKLGKQQDICSYEGNYPIVCCKEVDPNYPGAKSLKYCRESQNTKRTIVGGGMPSLAKEFPHMAALGYDNNGQILWACGGSLISPKFVLTAAHCLSSSQFASVKYVRLGDLNLNSDADDAQPQDFQVVKMYKHPLYKRPSKYHDIALLELDRAINVTKYVRPACLNIKKNSPKRTEYIATGWGLLSFHGEQSDHLQKVTVSEVDNAECNKFYTANQRLYNKGIVDTSQICAGNPGKDTCQGDSGGPLQTYNFNFVNAFNIHGVTSFGKACLLTKSPGVYTRVANYIDWIEAIVWP